MIGDDYTVDESQFRNALNGKCETIEPNSRHNKLLASDELIFHNSSEIAHGGLQAAVDPENDQQKVQVLSLQERSESRHLFETSCASCHGKGQGIELDIDWTNIESIKKYRSSNGLRPIDKIRSGEMPADKSLNPSQISLLIRALSF